MRKLRWFAAVALMCGCSREEAPQRPAPQSTEAPRETSKPAAAADPRPVIACFGDSITAGFGLDPGKSFPDLLQQDLDRHHYVYRAANFGVSGDTTQDAIARLPMVLAEKPAIVLLEFGGNDGLRGLPISITEGNLASMIEAFQKAGARVVLAGMTLPPNYGPDYIRKFEALYRGLAAKYRVPLIPFLLEGVGGNPQFMQRDGLHPNAEGARRVETLVWRAVEPLLR